LVVDADTLVDDASRFEEFDKRIESFDKVICRVTSDRYGLDISTVL
jgi:hypothetical protein